MRILSSTVLSVSMLLCGLGSAADPSILVPADVQLAAHVDIDRMNANPLGRQLILAFRSGIAASLNGDPESASPAEMIDALGFDPIAETQGVTAICSDFETPKQSVAVIIELGQTTGNLEGLLLAMPEYQSSLHRDYQVHSIVLDGDRLFGSVHTAGDGTKRIIAGLSQQPVLRVLDHFDGQTGTDLSRRLPQSTGNIADINLFSIPRQSITEPPFSVAAEIVQSAAISLADAGANLQVNVTLTSEVDAQAEQLRQMIQGSVAMLTSMARDGGDPSLAMAAGYLESIEIRRDAKQVTVSLNVPQDMIAEQLAGAFAN